jgi:hypothetical protein
MNTNRLKKFAQETRNKLLEQVSAKLDYVLTSDTPELREKASLIAIIKDEIENQGKQQLIDKVAYTWFNRLIALRYMDVNEYQTLGIRILSALPGQVSPQILQDVIAGNIPAEITVDTKRIFGLLDGRIETKNAENDAYRLLLIGACNHLNKVFPFLFERIDDYTELLLPDDLTSQFSILHDIIEGMDADDCKQVEVIGWLYQFYISEKNEELISSKKRYDTSELAPASQLFTPKWIVQYMVDNTLGQLWSEINPNSKVLEALRFYIKPAYKDKLQLRKKSIEEITFFEPCVGSGHILSYAFDVFYKIYEEEGYNPSEIPEKIITKNLWGVDIDPRAAQLASFVLMMKAREKHARFFKKAIQPNIYHYENFPNDKKFEHATTLGTLIKVKPNEADKIKVDENSLFEARQNHLKKLYQLLGQRYDVVVTNPPYIGYARMEGRLKQYTEENYPSAKSDLFSAFMLRCLELTNEDGLTGNMTPFVWMFISSYEELRKELIDKHFINNLVQLEYSGFDGATVPICTFTLRNKYIRDGEGSYIRLTDFKGAKLQGPKTLEAIQNNKCGWFYTTDQREFLKISGNPLAYESSKGFLKAFEKGELIGKIGHPRKGMVTANNPRFIRLWYEEQFDSIGFEMKSRAEALKAKRKWFPYTKGGAFRKWGGNIEYVVNWENDGKELLNLKSEGYKVGSTNHNFEFIFKPCIVWTKITSDKQSFRLVGPGYLFDDASGLCHIPDEEDLLYVLGLLNTSFIQSAFKNINPTLNLQAGNVASIPVLFADAAKKSLIKSLVKDSCDISTLDWNRLETSWGFLRNELITHKGYDLQESYDLYHQYWRNKFFRLHKNEVEINSQFIEIYELQKEMTAEVSMEDITILQGEIEIANGQPVFNAQEIASQFISYAVGCMFGRYSLDKDGLILANEGKSIKDYYRLVGKDKDMATYAPDADNIIPVLEDEWFEDDIVSRFRLFLIASFGDKLFQKNLHFLEEQLGSDVRKYLTKNFYADHIQRYKKRPIYWMFSSPKGYFNVLIYLHRYSSDTLNNILNRYLREFIEKLKSKREQLKHLQVSGSASEKTKAVKEIDKIDIMLADCHDYERNILYPLATERIDIDPDNGILVNYNCFGKAVKEVKGLNDIKTKTEVKKFDWIDPKIIQ